MLDVRLRSRRNSTLNVNSDFQLQPLRDLDLSANVSVCEQHVLCLQFNARIHHSRPYCAAQVRFEATGLHFCFHIPCDTT